MKKIFFILFLLFYQISFSQNLVPNWSFEDTVQCPFGLTQIDFAVGWSSYSITPDYFNTCAPSSVVPSLSIPHNIWGDQYAKTGNACAGIIAFASIASNQREYIGIQLYQSLVIGQKYFLSFYVSTAYGYTNGFYPNLACNNIGARFSTVANTQSNPHPVDNLAHINNSTIINDTINWVKISGSFTADSAYQYMSIGNFFDDTNTSYSLIGNSNPKVAYYYLDDIKLSVDSNFVNGTSDFDNIDLITVFPNPVSDYLFIQGNYIREIILSDLVGKCRINLKFYSSTHMKINVESFNKGIYFLSIKTSKRIITQKIIIY